MKVADVPDLPAGLADHLAADGITELYPPQADAVNAGVTRGESVVASIPTASGKTLIATLAMLSSIERGGKALYIVPLRALASEKRDEFAAFEDLGYSVGVSTGNYESNEGWLASRDIIVATSEKVDSLVRNDAGWLSSLSCVVADEVHLVDDASRGPTLEVTLAKLRHLNPALQTVALSATIGNADDVADWLDAELVHSTWRPIELRTGVHVGDTVYFGDGTERSMPVGSGERQTAAIVKDTLADDGSTLVFVNSRRNAEAAAKRLASTVVDFLGSEERNDLEAVAAEIREVSDTETSEDLAAVVAEGVAFHHAGLAPEHRKLVEDAFRARKLKAVCATPTLAAGVNTPSRRVIVRDWRRYDGTVGGMAPLDVLEVHQMFGRAGRPGLDPFGEALLVANSVDEAEELVSRYIEGEPEPVRSKLAAEPALRTHVLATVASGFARSREGLLGFLDETLYAAQSTEPGRLERVTDRVVRYLEANEFLRVDGESIDATSLGHTVSRLYLDPMSAAEIVDGLRSLRKPMTDDTSGFETAKVLRDGADDEVEVADPTAFGLYQLVSRTPDMYELYLRSGDRERYTEIAAEREGEFMGRAPSTYDNAFEDWLSATKTASMLEDWASEIDEDRIAERYHVGPGDIRAKVDTAEWLLSAAERLASELDLGCAGAVRNARVRVQHGVQEELLDLVAVRGVGRKRARRLFDRGVETRADLRSADKAVVLSAVRGRRKTAEQILSNAGRDDASLDDVADEDVDVPEAETEAGQANLGDF